MKFKDFLKEKGISEDDFAKKTASEMAQLHSEFSQKQLDELKQKVDKSVSEDQLQEAKDNLENFINETQEANKAFAKSEEIEKMQNRLKDLETKLESAEREILSAKENSGKKNRERLKLEKSTIDGIKQSLDDKSNAHFEFAIKALVLSSTAVNNNTYAFREDGIDDIAHRKITLLDIFPRTTLPADHSGTVKYREWDEATTAQVVEAIEEGAAFPEMTLRWKEGSESVKKIGTSVPVTEEFAMDEATLYAEINDFFRDYVTLFEEEQIYQGDNTAGQLNGFHTQAPSYVAVAKGVQAANIFDLALDVKESINRGKGSRISADTMVMNLGTINKFLRTKADDGQYVWAPWVVVEGDNITIAGMRVVESNLVADNEMDVFDSTKARIFEYENYTFRTGHVQNQFLEDEETLKARKKMLLRIKSNDLQAFRKVADIDASLVTLGQAPV